MAERVEPYDLQIELPLRWEPNAPDAFLVSDDEGRAALAMRAHPDDEDRRCVVLRWDSASYVLMSPPNDEARHQHRLYVAGLKDVHWVGIVRDSRLAAQLRPMRSSTLLLEPLHFIVALKDSVVEVLAENLDLFRVAGSPRHAAPTSLSN